MHRPLRGAAANGRLVGNALSFGTGIGLSDLRLGLGSLAIHLPDGGAIHIEGFTPTILR